MSKVFLCLPMELCLLEIGFSGSNRPCTSHLAPAQVSITVRLFCKTFPKTAPSLLQAWALNDKARPLVFSWLCKERSNSSLTVKNLKKLELSTASAQLLEIEKSCERKLSFSIKRRMMIAVSLCYFRSMQGHFERKFEHPFKSTTG